MRHLLLSTAAAAATAVGGITPALAIDYDYVEPRYTLDGEAEDGDATGFGVEASRSFNPWLFARLQADLYDVEINESTGDAPFDLFAIGPGLRVPLATGRYPVDLWGQVNYQRVAVGGRTENGLGIDAGLQMQVTNELQGRIAVTGMDDSDVNMDTYEARLAWSMNDDVAITGSLLNGDVEVGDQETELSNLLRIGVRFRY